MMFLKIKNAIEKKMRDHGIMGTETCSLCIDITDEERKVFLEGVDDAFDEHYNYDIEENQEKNNYTLRIMYTEEI